MKSIKLTTALYLASSFASQAIIFGDEPSMAEARNKTPNGAYPIRTSTEFTSTSSKDGTAVYIETEEGRCFGLTSAHALNPEGKEVVGLIMNREQTEASTPPSNIFNLYPLNAFQKHPSYGCDLLPFSSLPTNGTPEKGKMYLEKSNNDQLHYVVLAPNGEKAEGILDISLNEDLTPEILSQHKKKILEQTSQKGHTQGWEENVKHDIGIFSLKKKASAQLPHKFKGGFYDGPLNDGEEYDVVVSSRGPSFDNQLTSYEQFAYHEAPTRITYNASGFFTKITESKDFYLLLSCKEAEKPEWFFSGLPSTGDICMGNGDSGRMVKTQDGKLLALEEGVSWKHFYEDNQDLAQHLINFRQEKITDNPEETLLQKIHTDIADSQQTKKLALEGNRGLYRFTLKENFSPIKIIHYFTPLSIHKEFMEDFINEHKWQTQPNLPRNELYQHLKSSFRIFKENLEFSFLYAKAGINVIIEQRNKILEEIDKINKKKDAHTQDAETYRAQKNETLEKLYQGISSRYPSIAGYYTTILNEYGNIVTDYFKIANYYVSMIDLRDTNKELLSWWNAKKLALKEVDFQPSLEDKEFIDKLLNLAKEVQEKQIPQE